MTMIRVTIAVLAMAAGAVWAQTSAPATATAPGTMAASGPASAPAAPVVVTGDMPEELKAKITESVALIDGKKYEELLEQLAPPEAVAQIKQRGEMPKFLERMEEMGPKLRAALVTAAGQTPEMGTDGEGRATAAFPKSQEETPQLKFVMIEGRWTLR